LNGGILAPGAFFLGLLLPVIIAFYLLKLKRIEQEVPSTYLWRKMVRDVEANAPWQRLRPNLLMILQLLFLAVLILALARPFNWTEGSGGQAAIYILDTSASMSATDVAPNRLESAKQRAIQLVDDLPDSARVTVIDAGREARVLISSSLDRRQAHLAVQEIRPGTGGSDLGVALELASAIAARQPGTEIVVLSDGRVELPKHLAIKGALRYIPFGLTGSAAGDNQAISLLTLESSPGSGSLTAFAQVTNYGEKNASRRLNLLADGQLINAFDLADIPAGGGQKTAIAEGLPAETKIVEVQLTGQDALALDDHAVAVRPDTQPVPVTLVTTGNRFIKTALSLLPGIVLTEQETAAPASPETAATPASQPTPTLQPSPTAGASGSDQAALFIYDNTVPDVLPASGSLLFIAPPKSTDFFTTTGLVDQPAARAIDPADPLLQNVSFSEISILDAVQIPLPDWATPVVSGDLPSGENTPLIFRGEVNGRRIAVLAFDLRHSDLPLQVAFPLLWSNLVDWLAPGARSPIPTQVAPGENLSFSAPASAQSTNGTENNGTNDTPAATVTRPDGSTVPLQPENGRFLFADTSQLGVYQVNFSGPSGSAHLRTASFAVNLFSPQESTLKPADNLPGLESQSAQTGTVPQKAMREWWRPLALLALGLLTGEWLVYQRAALARLRDLLLRRRMLTTRTPLRSKR
jgi:Ca-activated chloride channel homolog